MRKKKTINDPISFSYRTDFTFFLQNHNAQKHSTQAFTSTANFSTIIPLGNTLQLSFDDLDADQAKSIQYKIEHMTHSDWQPSSISYEVEYIRWL